MKTILLIFGTKNFNNSLDEIKEDLGFKFIYFDLDKFSDSIFPLVSGVIVENEICENKAILSFINKISNKPILLLDNKNFQISCKHDDKTILPVNFIELKSRIVNLITTNKFNKNSSVQIKSYILDKNEKKLKSENSFVIITEREVQLIELLFNEKKSMSKKIILKKIWNYAEDADTHTVETHVYRLRKKILNKFKDDNFIINSKLGYSI
jgi:hypothetical protein